MPIWFNEEIRKGIKKRKEYNRKWRNAKNDSDKQQYKDSYFTQKEKIKNMIKDEITEHEKNVTLEIRADKNNRKIWEHINKLRGKKKKTKKEIILYDDAGNKMKPEKYSTEIKSFWKTIYMNHENSIGEVWNEGIMQDYAQTLEEYNRRTTVNIQNEEIEIPWMLREHMDAGYPVDQDEIQPMHNCEITDTEIELQLKETKKGKAAGPNEIKSELLIAILDSDKAKKALRNALNRTLRIKDIPGNWKISNTSLLDKIRKPTEKDLRPIALTDTTYKLMMGIIRSKSQLHLKVNKKLHELQTAYAEGRRAADNLFILKYCVAKSFKLKKMLIITAVDFKKAFDSIKRDTLIKVMMKYKIHPKIIDFIAAIYSGDKTRMYMNDTLQCEVNITNGIRQGCNGSTVLFLMVTYLIIDKLTVSSSNFKCDVCVIAAIFFADDGLLMAQSVAEAEEGIRILVEVAQECGLELNKEKSNILVFNNKEETENIEGINVTTEIKYLGIKVVNKRNCFKEQKQKAINEAYKFANIVPSVISRSCNKLLIGSTYWKHTVLPLVMYGAEVLNYTKVEIEKIQKAEYKAYRHMMNAPRYTPVSGLRGEVGASSHLARDIKTKFNFLRHLQEEEESLLNHILKDMLEISTDTWTKTVQQYMKMFNLNKTKISKLKKEKINDMVKAWDTNCWRQEIESKTSLALYKEGKTEIRNEQAIYDNTYSTDIMFPARTNTLKLGWRKAHANESTKCPMCDEEEENLEHFILNCRGLQEIREISVMLQRPYSESTMKKFLLSEKTEQNSEKIERNKRTLLSMWKKRKTFIQVQQQEQQVQ